LYIFDEGYLEEEYKPGSLEDHTEIENAELTTQLIKGEISIETTFYIKDS